MPRFTIRDLLIVLAIGPPLLAVAWWCHSGQIPIWIIVAATLFSAIQCLFAAIVGYAIDGLGNWFIQLPGGNDRKDAIFTASRPAKEPPPAP